MNQNIDTKLDCWKKSMLDSGECNRLINCPSPEEKGQREKRHTLLIKNPSSSELWRILVEESNQLVFPISNSTVLTNQSEKETYKTLHALKNKSRDFDLEKGINALYLAFGFLNWTAKNANEQVVRSPLLLLPVQLSQEDVSSPIVLSKTDDEITTNLYLEKKLLEHFKIKLPTFNEETTLEEYLTAVKEAIREKGWTISDDLAQLSLL